MKKFGFTIMEVLIVITLLGLIAAFAIPNYTESVRKAHETDMANQLSALHSSNMLYFAQSDGEFWDSGGLETNLPTINNTLNINLIRSDGTTFNYTGTTSAFTAQATWGGFTLEVSEAALDGNNPSCAGGGTCPTIP